MFMLCGTPRLRGAKLFETKVALDSDNIKLSMPVMKVDVEKRMVHGFATLDNVDKQADIVTKEASMKAFSRFRGNIREQHDPKKAVGRVVDFKEDNVFDPETSQSYNGVFVSAYVSKGAEDTWQKVLDGTLSGFSIGGAIKDTEMAFTEKSENPVRIIHEYDLMELSLVDNPANQLANVISIEKSDSGFTVETPLVKGGIENIFWCESDGLITMKASDAEECAMCQSKMQNVGFVETGDKEKESAVKSAVVEFKKNLKEKEAKNMAEDAIVEEEIEKSETLEESVSDEATVEKTEAEVSDESELVEKTEESDEEAKVEKTEVAEESESVEKTESDVVIESLVSSLTKMTDIVKALESKIDEMAKSIDSVKTDVSEVKDVNTEFGKRVEAVESTTAFRKSGDLGEVVQEPVQKAEPSLWGGSFLNTANL